VIILRHKKGLESESFIISFIPMLESNSHHRARGDLLHVAFFTVKSPLFPNPRTREKT
jgi:hypothetical protein